ncbi:hypothetical protein M011DRAFT_454609 [Sporormia fimetaria CBS 119925]|uniref:Uncharacterized protein n=1 Tax=Sporormia fimetaria CBS 119925 TaxID=1340428 RepID=A0A6A6VPF9_9PLEO|nr:hypothetical protein M011DRAFT_454609 [Sporormia fimetaria CBS 119925]
MLSSILNRFGFTAQAEPHAQEEQAEEVPEEEEHNEEELEVEVVPYPEHSDENGQPDWDIITDREADAIFYEHGGPGISRDELDHLKKLAQLEHTRGGSSIVVELGPDRTVRTIHVHELPRGSMLLLDVAQRQPCVRNIWLQLLSAAEFDTYINMHSTVVAATAPDIAWEKLFRLAVAAETLRDHDVLDVVLPAMREKAKTEPDMTHAYITWMATETYKKTTMGSALRYTLVDIVLEEPDLLGHVAFTGGPEKTADFFREVGVKYIALTNDLERSPDCELPDKLAKVKATLSQAQSSLIARAKRNQERKFMVETRSRSPTPPPAALPPLAPKRDPADRYKPAHVESGTSGERMPAVRHATVPGMTVTAGPAPTAPSEDIPRVTASSLAQHPGASDYQALRREVRAKSPYDFPMSRMPRGLNARNAPPGMELPVRQPRNAVPAEELRQSPYKNFQFNPHWKKPDTEARD